VLVLLDHQVPEHVLSVLAGENLCYRPDLSDRPPARAVELSRLRPNVLVTRVTPQQAEVDDWRSAAGGVPLVVITVGADPVEHGAATRHSDPALVWDSISDGVADPYPAAFALAERRWLDAALAPTLAARLSRPGGAAHGGSVALVGAGVVNLLTALRLAADGHEVAVYDRSPDPRESAHWTAFGCTRGGGDARMFTLTEADGYHRMTDLSAVPFQVPVADAGWRVAEADSVTDQDLSWVQDNVNIPPWLARSYTADILTFNRASGELWRELIDEEPALFGDVGLREGILRLYTDAGHFAKQVARQDQVGALRRVLTPDEIAERHPALGETRRAGLLVGGIETLGFTVQVHRFIANLLGLLEQAGVALHWQQPVSRASTGPGSRSAALVTASGPVPADHYVLSPGAYCGELLRGTSSSGQIHGVLGVWVTVPNREPALTHSLKLSRTGHIAEDANITVAHGEHGRPELLIGSGYGWTGADPSNIDPQALDVLYRAVEDTAARLLPSSYDDARRSGLLDRSRRYCVRPWTASSLPILELVELGRGGLMIVTGGHNTGGFAQAPVVAQAVAAALSGRSHLMHTLYHPDRLRLFYNHR